MHSEACPKKIEILEDLGRIGGIESRKRLGDKVVQFGVVVFETGVYSAYPMHFAARNIFNVIGVKSNIL